MTRGIEFRGFDGTKWYYGDLKYNRKVDVAVIHIYEKDGSYYRQYTVDPDTVGQFTGMTDKHGRKIYEGDIVKTQISKNFLGIVTWHTDGYFFFDTSNGEWKRWADGYRPIGEMLRLRCDGKFFEFAVGGNIHNNPELSDKKEIAL